MALERRVLLGYTALRLGNTRRQHARTQRSTSRVQPKHPSFPRRGGQSPTIIDK